MMEFFRRIKYRLNRRHRDAELQADMEFHREMMERQGRRDFGSMLRLTEQAREAWGWTWMDRLGQDLKYGLRVMARSPGFTITAVLVLAIGIGINVSAFSLFNMVALKPLPVRDPRSLVRLERRSSNGYNSEMAYPSFLFYRDHSRTLSAAMAVLGIPPMQIEDDSAKTSSSFVTANYFTQLGTRAALGRLLEPVTDEAAGAPPVMVITYGLWQQRFGSDPAVVGRMIHLNKKPVTIVGVAPYAFATLGGQGPDIWLPITQQPYFVEGSKILHDFQNSSVRMWGRLATGVSVQAATQELRTLTNELRREQPDAVAPNEFLQISAGGTMQVMQPEMYKVCAMVAVLTLLILAVACGNLGALLLARAVQRQHEITTRVAIGASAARVFRQLCTESLLLATFGSLAGLGLGCIILRIAFVEMDVPKWLTVVPDWRVLLFAVAMSFVSAIFFGLAPALQLARQRQRKTTFRQVLVGAQVAGSCVLLIVSGLLVRATQHALYTNPGFGYEGLVSIDSQLAQHGYNAGTAQAYLDQMQTRLLSVPGVRAVSFVQLPPLGHTVSNETREINGRQVTIYPNWVAPNFFQAMEIPLLMGRTFRPGEKNVVVVSQSFARIQWQSQNPLGKLVGDGATRDTVVGVVGDAHLNALSDDDATEQYWPASYQQMPVLIVRTAGALEGLDKTARAISDGIDPKLFPEIRQIKMLYRDNVLGVERAAGAVTLIGLVAGLLAGVGLIGLVSFTVRQKRKEIAIRIAVGASHGEVLRVVLQQFSWPVAIGLVTGTGCAAFASKVLRRALYGVSNLDPVGYVGAIGLLLVILIVATLLPASRALKVNLAKALHYE